MRYTSNVFAILGLHALYFALAGVICLFHYLHYGLSAILLSAAGMHASAEVIRLARELNPAIRILARSAYVREIPALHQAGAERVCSGEGEVALALTEAILRTLGATPEQIDRERDRVHADLFDRPTVTARQDSSAGQPRHARDT